MDQSNEMKILCSKVNSRFCIQGKNVLSPIGAGNNVLCPLWYNLFIVSSQTGGQETGNWVKNNIILLRIVTLN